jgi:hypothetical protein
MLFKLLQVYGERVIKSVHDSVYLGIESCDSLEQILNEETKI